MTVWPGVFFLELPGGCQLSLSGLEGLCWGIRPIRPSAGLASSATGLTGRLKSGLQAEGEAEAMLLCNNVNAFGLDRCAEKYFARRECGALHHCLPGSLVKM